MKEKTSILRNLLFVLFAAILITSCEEDKGPTAEEMLTGTWTSQSSTFNIMVENQPILQYFTGQGFSASEAQLLSNLFNVTMQQAFTGNVTFNADKTYTSTLGGESDSGTWSLSDDGDELTLDSNLDNPIVFDVETLTEDELVVSFQRTGAEDLNDDMIPESISVDVTLTFNKQ